ncbi:MAG: MFS transporter [Acetobacteraceae bacterium]|nr:MFS transporter [Acetobacteraceae bacterium]
MEASLLKQEIAAPAFRLRAAWLAPGLLGLTIIMIALNGRMNVSSLGPVLGQVIHDLGLSPAGASLLTTLPTLVFGLGAPLGPLLARRAGVDRSVLIALLVTAGATALRAVPTEAALFAGQILSCAGIAVINVLGPSLVRHKFPHRTGLMTGLFTMGICAGGALSAAATAPLATAIGSWSCALAFWALPAVLTAGLGAAYLQPGRDRVSRGLSKRKLWRDPVAWQVTLFMAMQSALGYIQTGWLPVILADRGMSTVDAGLVLSFSMVAQSVVSPFVPSLIIRLPDQRIAAVLATAVSLISLVSCLLAPLPAIWMSAAVLGAGQASMFAIALTFIVIRAPGAASVAQLSAMAQGIGYLLASVGPFLAGLLYYHAGRNAVAALIAILCAIAAFSGLGAGRPRSERPDRGLAS